VLRRLKNHDGSAMGVSDIADKATEFSDSWSYAVQQIGEHASDLDKFVQKVSDTFSKIDQQLENAMTGKGGNRK
jgi:hypothetical protein